MASMPSISLSPWVPQPMYARLIFSLGGTNPGPPSTCRGTIANVVAAAPLASMNLRRERPEGRDWFVVTLVFIGFHSFLFRVCPKGHVAESLSASFVGKLSRNGPFSTKLRESVSTKFERQSWE